MVEKIVPVAVAEGGTRESSALIQYAVIARCMLVVVSVASKKHSPTG